MKNTRNEQQRRACIFTAICTVICTVMAPAVESCRPDAGTNQRPTHNTNAGGASATHADPQHTLDGGLTANAATRWVSNDWPAWEPAATQYHGERCERMVRLLQDSVLSGPGTDAGVAIPRDPYGLGPVSAGRGASLPSNEYQRWDHVLSQRCIAMPFSFFTAETELDCTHARLVTEAVQRRIEQVQACSGNSTAITVVMDVAITAGGRIVPIEASVAPWFVAMAECVAQRIANADGPTHAEAESARARLIFRWSGPCR